jgi:hypothetical protein
MRVAWSLVGERVPSAIGSASYQVRVARHVAKLERAVPAAARGRVEVLTAMAAETARLDRQQADIEVGSCAYVAR